MSSCRLVAKGEPRIIPGRHSDDCAGGDCAGCLECPEPHCDLCTRRHDEHTCPSCVGDVRDDIYEMKHLYDELPEQARYGSNAKGRLLAAGPIPGGDAMVMMAGGGSAHIQRQLVARGHVTKFIRGVRTPTDEHLADEVPGDPESVLYVLTSWEDDWRAALGHDASERTGVSAAVGYLTEHLGWAAQNHPEFVDFAKHIRRCLRRLEDVLYGGERDEISRDVTCLQCGTYLRRRATEQGVEDDWSCVVCHRTLTTPEYNMCVAEAARAGLFDSEAPLCKN